MGGKTYLASQVHGCVPAAIQNVGIGTSLLKHIHNFFSESVRCKMQCCSAAAVLCVYVQALPLQEETQ